MSGSEEKGSALLAIMLATMVVVAIIVVYQQMTSQVAVKSGKGSATSKAMLYAENAADLVKDINLRDPSWRALNLAPGTPLVIPNPIADNTSGGYSETTVIQSITDASLFDLVTTGYFDITKGNTTNPQTGHPSSMAVIQQKIRLRSIGDFFAAVPTTLQIAYGTDLSGASVYARNLVFLPPDLTAASVTTVGSAYYFNSIQYTPNSVVFGATPFRLPAEPNLATIDASMQTLYRDWAGTDQLTGTVTTLAAPANPNGVFVSRGNLTLGGTGGTLNIPAPIVIYVEGDVLINANIIPVTLGAWLAVVAEGDIVLSNTLGNNTLIAGTFATAKSFYAQPRTPPAGKLAFAGGFDAQSGANLVPGWTNRVYGYRPPPRGMPLPYFISVEEYNVTQGKYGQ